MTARDVLKVHREKFYGSLLSGDIDALGALYSDDYMLVRTDGSKLNKKQVLHDLREGGLRFQSIELFEEEVRVSGDVAILAGESRTTVVRDGAIKSAQFRLVAVYLNVDGVLRLTYFQSTFSKPSTA